MIATFNGNPKLTVVSCYSPTNTDDETTTDFYGEISSLIRQIPKHNVKIIAGDMNVKIGSDKCEAFSFHEITNRNGEFILELISDCSLINLNIRFHKKKGKQWPVTYPNGGQAQLDHILIDRKWKNMAINCEAYNTFKALQSGH